MNTKPQLTCLCAGLRRRNATLCLKCEISMMPDTFKELESDAYDAGYHQAKNDIIDLINHDH
jgi:hypothetical protein